MANLDMSGVTLYIMGKEGWLLTMHAMVISVAAE